MDIDAIKKRLAAAHKGPWSANRGGSLVFEEQLSEPGKPYFSKAEDDCILGPNKEEVLGSSEWMRVKWEDLEFMACARQDIEDLLAESERDAARIAELKSALKVAFEYCPDDRDFDYIEALLSSPNVSSSLRQASPVGEPVAWWIPIGDHITRDEEWARQHADMCEPLCVCASPAVSANKVPDDMMLVPKEPTENMVIHGGYSVGIANHKARDCYRRMLAAAPKPAVSANKVPDEEKNEFANISQQSETKAGNFEVRPSCRG